MTVKGVRTGFTGDRASRLWCWHERRTRLCFSVIDIPAISPAWEAGERRQNRRLMKSALNPIGGNKRIDIQAGTRVRHGDRASVPSFRLVPRQKPGSLVTCGGIGTCPRCLQVYGIPPVHQCVPCRVEVHHRRGVHNGRGRAKTGVGISLHRPLLDLFAAREVSQPKVAGAASSLCKKCRCLDECGVRSEYVVVNERGG